MFENKQTDITNKDLNGFNLQYYLDKASGFVSSFKPFNVKEIRERYIIDESESCEVGYKARAGEMLISKLAEAGINEVVYVQPRQGFAGISLSYLCKKYGLKLTLVMPSSKEASPHQLLCIELGAKPLFLRVAAMPNANAMAKKYAEATGAYYVPLGLYHEDVIACGVKQIHDFFKDREHPKTMWSAMSTGVLTRTLQIALPSTSFVAVQVARNVQPGELGRARFLSYHKAFNQRSDMVPKEFDTEPNYDAKAYDYFDQLSAKGDWFFNVAGKAPETTLKPHQVDSYRDWNDLRDFENYLN